MDYWKRRELQKELSFDLPMISRGGMKVVQSSDEITYIINTVKDRDYLEKFTDLKVKKYPSLIKNTYFERGETNRFSIILYDGLEEDLFNINTEVNYDVFFLKVPLSIGEGEGDWHTLYYNRKNFEGIIIPTSLVEERLGFDKESLNFLKKYEKNQTKRLKEKMLVFNGLWLPYKTPVKVIANNTPFIRVFTP